MGCCVYPRMLPACGAHPYTARCAAFADPATSRYLTLSRLHCEGSMEFRWCPLFNTSTPCDGGELLPVPSPTDDAPLARPSIAEPTPLDVLASREADYRGALRLAVRFFEAQRSGRVDANASRVPWTRSSFLADGEAVGLDLTGGYADAGDYVKPTKTIAHTMTLLAWSLLDFGNEVGAETAGFGGWSTHAEAVEALQWGADYLLRCHPSPDTLIVQVGDFVTDHASWGPPPVHQPPTGPRRVFSLTRGQPMTDVAAEAAAALAAAAAAAHATGDDGDGARASQLLSAARSVLALAEAPIGPANANNAARAADTFPQCGTDECFYWTFADGVADKRAWAWAWMARAEGLIGGTSTALTAAARTRCFALLDAHLANVSDEARASQPFSWDSKWPAVYVLAARLGHVSAARAADAHLSHWTPPPRSGNGTRHARRTPGGLVFYQPWGSLRYATHIAMLAVVHLAGGRSRVPRTLWVLARSQANYALGHNPSNRSFLTGFGVHPPTRVHHRWASGLDGGCARARMRTAANRYTLPGALVAGPYCGEAGMHAWECDAYADRREDAARNEVALDFNAGLVGVLAGLVSMPHAPPPAPPAATPPYPPWREGAGCCTWPRPPLLVDCAECLSFANSSNWISFSSDNCLATTNRFQYTWCEPPADANADTPLAPLVGTEEASNATVSGSSSLSSNRRAPHGRAQPLSILLFLLELLLSAASFVAAFASIEKIFVLYLWAHFKLNPHRASEGRWRCVSAIEPDAVGAAAEHAPRVCVQLPIYNDRAVCERVIDAACRLRYPSSRLEIFVMDDSSDEETRTRIDERVAYWASAGVDIKLCRRPNRAGFKAGNMLAFHHLVSNATLN